MQEKIVSSRISRKSILQFLLALIPVAFCIYFIRHEGYELQESLNQIGNARLGWLLAGFAVTILYLLIHAGMYVSSFASIRSKVTYSSALILSLKRSFISVFLPAGGISSLAFFTRPIENQGISKTRIHLASVIYGIFAFVSLFLISIPAVILLLNAHELGTNVLIAFLVLFFLIIFLLLLFRSFVKGKFAYRMAERFLPRLIVFFEEIREQNFSMKGLLGTLLFSLLIEICGIAHLYISLKALNVDAPLSLAVVGYVTATLLLAVSPFMRGLGAVELSLTFLLIRSGIPQVSAISVTLLYRLFEFWIPLMAGGLSFMYRKDHLVMRILPSLFTLLLGIVNIFSILTPAIAGRLTLLRDFIPEQAIHFSNFAVLVSGIILVVLSTYMLRGLRNSWIAAVFVASVSLIGHLTKAIDYEEALACAFFIGLLVYTRKNYQLKNDKTLIRNSGFYLGAGVVFILIYGIAGFYLMDRRHFGIDFSIGQSLQYLANAIILVNNDSFHPRSVFGRDFIYSLNFLGVSLFAMTAYFGLKPARYREQSAEEELQMARELTGRYGNSSLDYFKTYKDKSIFIHPGKEAFISFRTAGDYAVVLEGPVCENETLIPAVLDEFEAYCAENGLKAIYYRVDEAHLNYYSGKGKKTLFIGQEGIVDVSTFTLEGGDKKSTRNALNKLDQAGFTVKTAIPPVKEGLIQKLKAVSMEWLEESGKKESAFSQGVWDPAELKNQVIIYVEDPEEKVVAFVNIIPDYAPGEGTYDLIRKTKDAPSKVLDALMVHMIRYFKEQGMLTLNLGLAPFSGIEKGRNLPEISMKFAYDNLKQLDHYKGLRFFKEKYAYQWKNKYLVYTDDLDLLQAPVIINKVSRYKS